MQKKRRNEKEDKEKKSGKEGNKKKAHKRDVRKWKSAPNWHDMNICNCTEWKQPVVSKVHVLLVHVLLALQHKRL